MARKKRSDKKAQSAPQQAALFAEDQLPNQQRQILGLLRDGLALEEASGRAEVSPETVRSWLRLDPSFAQALEEMQREEELALRNLARRAAKEGLNTLVEVMHTELEEVDPDLPEASFIIQAKAKAQKDLLQAKVKAVQAVLGVIPKSVWDEEQTKPSEGQKQASETQTHPILTQGQPLPSSPQNDPVLTRWNQRRDQGDC